MERRRQTRVQDWLPVQLEVAGGHLEGSAAGLAVTHDATAWGALLVTRAEIQVGELLRVTVPGQPGEGDLHRHAKVLRVSPNHQDPDGLWPHAVAVQFSDPCPELEERLRALKAPRRVDS